MSGRHAADDDRTAHEGDGPLLRVVAGSPSPEELAAVTAVLAALEAETAEAARATPRDVAASPSGWSSRAARLRRPIDRGPGRWRSFSA
ncbi:acyl-CoA carboxylase epsilon subunit [Frigoribacterium sp. PvP032]|uniref:acyl-CoA carboxylase epsilon subunit n=1 Tax=Frigoribacterium sp. PvP032 TaxID=2806589 RepID=UPI001AE9542B|nr:acyl-CoA carboxylase epsilon subunit [Frigoribacterium sp. PvP032]MBP1190227.1 uncharacterized protein (DUF1800 family) [Frigoribacterium sp. PvP032]